VYFAAGAPAVSASAAGSARRSAGEVTAPLAIEMDGGIVVGVRIRGHGPFRFRVDTGASRTVVSSELAARLDLPVSGSSVVVTPAGRTVRPLTAVDDLAAGCLSSGAVRAAVMPAVGLDPGRRIDGLIGQDVLVAHVYTLDYERAVLRCHATAGDRENGVRMPLTVTDGQALVSLTQPQGTLRLVPDSGADRLVLFARAGRSLNVLITPFEPVRAQSVSGHRLARRVLVQSLRVGDSLLDDHMGVLMDGPVPEALMGDGLLPLHLFARVTFNGREGYVAIESRR
jgi:hypothetical protein